MHLDLGIIKIYIHVILILEGKQKKLLPLPPPKIMYILNKTQNSTKKKETILKK